MTFASHVRISSVPVVNEQGSLVRNEYYLTWRDENDNHRFLVASSHLRAIELFTYCAMTKGQMTV